ncbi:MAG: hypothetical protein KL787_02415 [Taibaiella sp.]|nr:hypothetical protein [Taibaiella sp.]
MIPVYIHEYNAYTPLGNGIKQNMQALRGGVSGIQPRQGLLPGRQVMAAAIPDERIREDLKQLAHTGLPDTRIEQLLLLAAAPVFQNIEITGRTGVILSTTKGNVQALASGQLQDAGLTGLARFMQHYFRLPQLPMIICNACVSGGDGSGCCQEDDTNGGMG